MPRYLTVGRISPSMPRPSYRNLHTWLCLNNRVWEGRTAQASQPPAVHTTPPKRIVNTPVSPVFSGGVQCSPNTVQYSTMIAGISTHLLDMVTVWVKGILCLLLQVTEKLMQAEEKKLKVLKSEIEAGRHSDSAVSSAKVL